MSEKDAKAWLERVAPDIQDFLNRIAGTNPQACITGFIFSATPKALIQLGNIGNEGEELIRIHHVLSNLVGEVKRGNYAIPFLEIVGALYPPDAKKKTENPTALAEELAKLVIVTNLDPKYTDRCLELANRYLAAISPPAIGEPPVVDVQ